MLVLLVLQISSSMMLFLQIFLDALFPCLLEIKYFGIIHSYKGLSDSTSPSLRIIAIDTITGTKCARATCIISFTSIMHFSVCCIVLPLLRRWSCH